MTRSSKNARLSSRRNFLRYAGSFSALAMFDSLLPAWAREMRVAPDAVEPGRDSLVFDLAIAQHRMDIAGGNASAKTINNSIPGPLLQWQEGRDVVLNVANRLDEDTSIHWHGIILPFEMDGVPGVTFKGIAPDTTFQYRFAVNQNGTYWYHSHSGLQEQEGVYGPLVIHPAEPEPNPVDRDYVIMLSDWTFEDPWQVMARLKKVSDYYNFQQVTVEDLLALPRGASRRAAIRNKLAWDRMRMMSSDIADVGGATYSFLMNGLHPAGNWTGLFKPGERIRLRFINGSAMSIFNIRVPGLKMTVVAADGLNVQPVSVDEFQISTAETFDVIVEPDADQAYTIMAESIDRSGYAAGTLAPQIGMRAAIPALRKPPKLTMTDMGMDHGAMGNMEHADMDNGAVDQMDHAGMEQSGMDHGDMAGMDHSGMDHGDMAGMDHSGMDHGSTGGEDHSGHDMPDSAGPIVARHGPDHHGVGNAGVATVQRNRLGEPGTGLEDVQHRVLVYTDLRRLERDFDDRPPDREIELHLTGHMERYMWSFDGVQFHEVDSPIEFRHGERLRLTLVNDTMMNHPIHLHGMWMELENGQSREIPRKHTINVKPASRVSALINADAPGRWAFHCHLLYHMEMGMFRVVRVS